MRATRLSIAALAAVALLGPPALASASTIALAVAGDIACTPGETGTPPGGMPNGDNCQQAGTAQLAASLRPDAVAMPGDIQYQSGRLSEFLGSFDLSWGLLKPIVYPAPGNHEYYDTPNGAGYFDYFDGVGAATGRAGDRGKGYYSVDLSGGWHLITLNSNCTSDSALITRPVPCAPGSAQERWLRADLAAHRNQCVIAQWHHPLFTSGPNQGGPNDLATRSFWNDLYAARATLVLNGHDHDYERFAPQTPAGAPDPRHGLREFVIGTGGKSLFGPRPHTAANSVIYDNTTLGVMLFTLGQGGYSWAFHREPVAGNGTLADHGSARCNGPRAHARSRHRRSR